MSKENRAEPPGSQDRSHIVETRPCFLLATEDDLLFAELDEHLSNDFQENIPDLPAIKVSNRFKMKATKEFETYESAKSIASKYLATKKHRQAHETALRSFFRFVLESDRTDVDELSNTYFAKNFDSEKAGEQIKRFVLYMVSAEAPDKAKYGDVTVRQYVQRVLRFNRKTPWKLSEEAREEILELLPKGETVHRREETIPKEILSKLLLNMDLESRLFYSILKSTGCRPFTELFSLELDGIYNLDEIRQESLNGLPDEIRRTKARYVVIGLSHTKEGINFEDPLVQKHTGEGSRLIVADRESAILLCQYLKMRPTGNPHFWTLTKSQLGTAWRRAMKKIGLAGVMATPEISNRPVLIPRAKYTPYILRSFFTSNSHDLKGNGMTEELMQRLIGHHDRRRHAEAYNRYSTAEICDAYDKSQNRFWLGQFESTPVMEEPQGEPKPVEVIPLSQPLSPEAIRSQLREATSKALPSSVIE